MRPQTITDSAALAAVVRAAAAGDNRAWEELHARFTPTLRAAARAFRLSSADVDDVVQQTWLAAVRYIDTLKSPQSIGAYLVVTVRREALRVLQRGVHEVVSDELPEYADPLTGPPEKELIDEEQRVALHAAVERLDGRKQRLLHALLHTPDASYVDLAERLRMPIGSIGPTRERALDRLRYDRILGTTMSGAAA